MLHNIHPYERFSVHSSDYTLILLNLFYMYINAVDALEI